MERAGYTIPKEPVKIANWRFKQRFRVILYHSLRPPNNNTAWQGQQVHSLEYTTTFEKGSGGQVSIDSDVSEDSKQHYKHSFRLLPIVCP